MINNFLFGVLVFDMEKFPSMPILIPNQNFRIQEFFRKLLHQELSMVSPELGKACR